MLGLLVLAATLGASWFGFSTARRFVRERLRYVDAALTPGAAIVAAIGAAIVAYPVVWLLPFVGTGTALIFGLGVGLGSRAGASDVKRGYRITDGV
jgi:hypothetical protein